MTDFAFAILDYWESILSGVTVVATGGDVRIAVNPALDRERRAMILEYPDGQVRAAIVPDLFDRVGLGRRRDMTADGLRRRLADAGVTLYDPDLLFYLPDRPSPVDASRPMPVARRLGDADREAFEAFHADASEADRDDAYVELDHWLVFGSFDGDRLVSVASVYRWDGAAIADLGVLTLPDVRGRGHATAVVTAIAGVARDLGHEPQYRCQTTNGASIALAKACGFALFGRWEVIDADVPDADAGPPGGP